MTQPLNYLSATAAHESAGEVPAEYDVFCEGCGYSLAGIVADRCPECGKPYDASELPFARIPWLHRRRIGWVYAYCATVLMVIFRTRRFARELCRPVRISLPDARKFRRVTLRLAVISLALGVAGALVLTNNPPLWLLPPPVLIRLALTFAFGIVAAAVLLALATDMPVFIWRGLPGRPPHELAPIHYYAAAPLALTPLACALAFATLAGGWFDLPMLAVIVAAAATLATLVVLVMMLWALPLGLMREATGCSLGRMWALLLYLPLHWLIIAVMIGAAMLLVMLTGEHLLQLR
jgi:hypothetical protein